MNFGIDSTSSIPRKLVAGLKCMKDSGILPHGATGLSAYQKLAQELNKEFPGKLDITGEGTPGITGWLEVTVGGKLVHSKKNGDGHVDTASKLKKIKDEIRTVLH